MTDHAEMFDSLQVAIEKRIPGFQVCYKDENFVSKLLGVLVFIFNPKYMKTYTTTRYPKVYFPTRKFVTSDLKRAWKILAHEYVHLWDRYHKPAFNFTYLLPQIGAFLALPAILAVWFSNWFLLFLVALILVLPWPASARRNAELRGYTMSMAINFWRYGTVSEDTKVWITENFTGWSYYKMWPFNMRKQIDAAVKDITNGAVFKWEHAEPYKEVHDLMQEKGLTR